MSGRLAGRPAGRTARSTVVLAGALLLLLLALGGCGGEDDSSKDAGRSTGTKTTSTTDGDDDGAKTTTDGMPTGKPGETVDVTIGTDPDAVDPAHPSNQTDPDAHPTPGDGSGITIVEPVPFTTVVKTVQLVAVHECGTPADRTTAKWSLTRGDGKALASGTLDGGAVGDTCTSRTTANVAKVAEGSYELHVTTFDGSGAKLGDTLVPISIHAKADPGDVDADAPPPGGGPQG